MEGGVESMREKYFNIYYTGPFLKTVVTNISESNLQDNFLEFYIERVLTLKVKESVKFDGFRHLVKIVITRKH